MIQLIRIAVAVLLLFVGLIHPAPLAQATGAWTAPENVSKHTADVLQASIALDGSGRIHVVWSDGEGIFHCLKGEDEWSVPQRVASGMSPDMAVDSAGYVYLVFSHRFLAEEDDVYFMFWQQETEWSLATNVSGTPAASLSPRLAVAPDNSLAMVWSEGAGDSFLIYLSQSSTGSLWSSAPIPNAHGVYPTVAFDSSDNLLVAWQDVFDLGFPMEIFFSQYGNDTWTLPVDVSASPATNSASVSIAECQGEIYLAWQESGQDGEMVYVANTIGDAWSVAEKRSGDVEAHAPALTFDALGSGHLVWTTWDSVQHRRWDPLMQSWQPMEDVATGQLNVDATDIAAVEAAHVTWLGEGLTASRDVWYSTKTVSPPKYERCFLPLLTSSWTSGTGN